MAIFVVCQSIVASQMSKQDPNNVRSWPRVDARIHPETNDKLKQKLKRTGDNQSEIIRRAIRDYTKD